MLAEQERHQHRSHVVEYAVGHGEQTEQPGRIAAPIRLLAAGNRQAVRTPAAFSRCRSWISISRIRNFWIFPVTVIGNESTKRMYCGILKCAIFPRQNSRISSSLETWPAFRR